MPKTHAVGLIRRNFTTLIIIYFLLCCEHLFTHMPVRVSQLTWILFEIELPTAVFLSIVYWSILYDPCAAPTFINVSYHALNSIVMLIDLFLNEIHFELSHSESGCSR